MQELRCIDDWHRLGGSDVIDLEWLNKLSDKLAVQRFRIHAATSGTSQVR